MWGTFDLSMFRIMFDVIHFTFRKITGNSKLDHILIAKLVGRVIINMWYLCDLIIVFNVILQ